MEYKINGHEECIGCGEESFIIRGYEKNPDGSLTARINMDERTEGWAGIPHGGFGMGAIFELVTGLDSYPYNPKSQHLSSSSKLPSSSKSTFPIRADFRMGGTGVVVGDTVTVHVHGHGGGAIGIIKKGVNKGVEKEIEKGGEDQPYITGNISFDTEDTKEKETFESFLPSQLSSLENRLIPLPHYTHCFVCGPDRKEPGLKREFHLFDDPKDSEARTVVSLVGFDAEDKDTFYYFKRGDIVHPIALLALGDETTGWGGFFMAKNGGVSVKLSYNFYRDVRLGEKIVFFGRGQKIKGDISKRLLFWATGGAAVIDEDGGFETVMTTSGQWFGLSALTEQMRTHLTPEEYRIRVFEMADN